MGWGVITFRVSPVDVAYAVGMCVTGFSEGPDRCTSGTCTARRKLPLNLGWPLLFSHTELYAKHYPTVQSSSRFS